MDIRDLVIEISEKIALIATAGLLTVLVPPLRSRLLGVGRQRDVLVAGLFGLIVAMWGGRMGVLWLGYNTHLVAIGVLIAAYLGGARTGAVIGLLAGLYYITRVDVLADGLLLHGVDEGPHHLEVDVGFQERHAYLAHGFLDVVLGQTAAAAQPVEDALQASAQGVEHGNS